MIVATNDPDPYLKALESLLEPAYAGAARAYAQGEPDKGNYILRLLAQALSLTVANHAIAAARIRSKHDA